MERLLVDESKHPFYQHASRGLFVAYQAGKPVGRIAAIKDDLQQQHDGNRMGFFGFFESIDDPLLATGLLDVASQWLREQGCDTIRGPVNPSMKAEFGVLVEGHETLPAIMTIHNHGYYEDLLKAAGLQVIREFNAFVFHSVQEKTEVVSSKWKKLFSVRDRVLQRFPELSFPQVTKENFEPIMRQMIELSNRVRSEGWGYVPLTEAEFQFMVKNLRRVIRYDMIHFAFWEDQMVGYIINIPDVNQALKRTIGKADWLRMIQMPFRMRQINRSRVIALGVDEAFRTKGIAMLLIAKLVEMYDTFDEWEFSWVDTQNLKSLRAIERTLPLVKSKTYRLYEKPIGK